MVWPKLSTCRSHAFALVGAHHEAFSRTGIGYHFFKHHWIAIENLTGLSSNRRNSPGRR